MVFDSNTSKAPSKNALLLARSNGLAYPRLGLVIGKKSVKLAVERNRLKRQIRESFRLNQNTLTGLDIVVVAKKGLGNLQNIELTQQFANLWQRIAKSKPSKTSVDNNRGTYGTTHA
jgi:ribonuclease P protein component